MSCLESTPAISLSALGSHFPEDEKPSEMRCGRIVGTARAVETKCLSCCGACVAQTSQE